MLCENIRILGLCNNFPYVIMLSAAFDILTKVENKSSNPVSLLVCLSVGLSKCIVCICNLCVCAVFTQSCYRLGPTVQWIIVNYNLIIVMV